MTEIAKKVQFSKKSYHVRFITDFAIFSRDFRFRLCNLSVSLQAICQIAKSASIIASFSEIVPFDVIQMLPMISDEY